MTPFFDLICGRIIVIVGELYSYTVIGAHQRRGIGHTNHAFGMIPQHGFLLLMRKCYDLLRHEFEKLLVINSIQGGFFHVGQYKRYGSFFILRGNLREAYFLSILTYLVNVTVVSNLPGKRIDVENGSSAIRSGFFETFDKVYEA